jgi:hypothetical protein
MVQTSDFHGREVLSAIAIFRQQPCEPFPRSYCTTWFATAEVLMAEAASPLNSDGSWVIAVGDSYHLSVGTRYFLIRGCVFDLCRYVFQPYSSD